MSNVSRAVTRTRRAVTSRKGTRIGAVPWPGPAVYRDAPAGEQQPPFTVTRRVPASRAPQGQPMDQYARWARYAEQTGAGAGRSPLTPGQYSRWAKKLRAAATPPKTPVSKPGQKGGASGKGQGGGGRTDPGGPVSPPPPKGK